MRSPIFSSSFILSWFVAATAMAQQPSLVHGKAPAAPDFPFAYAAAQAYQAKFAKSTELPVEISNAEGMTFVLVPPGTYRMGSPAGETGRRDEELQHTVTLTRPFYLSKFETTHGEFQRFVRRTKYVTDVEKAGGGHAHDAKAEWKHREGTSYLKPGFAGPFEMDDRNPAVHVSHTDSVAFCKWLQETAPVMPARGYDATYHLPTEAQWEWACRAGSSSRYWWGEDDDMSGRVANVGDKALKKVHPEWPRAVMPMNDNYAFLAPVGTYKPNGFGLYDMIGNVWEFCGSKSGPYGKDPVTDPGDLNPNTPSHAVRGGGWSNFPDDCRSAARNSDPPHFGHSNLGFRVAIQIRAKSEVTAEEVLAGLKEFYKKTARPDGSFQNGTDPTYMGMSDSAYSDLAAVTYAVTISKTFGWKLPYEEKTIEWLLSRQAREGHFFNVAGTVDPKHVEGRTYNTTQGLVALRALGVKPKYDPLPVFEEILKEEYKSLPAFSTSFFPLAYLCAGKPIPEKADKGIRALMIQDETGYMNDHVAATFHASHYYNLVGEETPKAQEMVARMIRDQGPDGSWLLNLPSRDRHATFDAVFTITHEGGPDAQKLDSVQRAAKWALSCRNPDGGFGHYPGSPSDADAIYFQVGTLVMAGFLEPLKDLKDPHLLSWGHTMPIRRGAHPKGDASIRFPGWIGGVAFDRESKRMVVGHSKGEVATFIERNFEAQPSRSERQSNMQWAKVRNLELHDGIVASVQLSPNGRLLASGGYDHKAILWDPAHGTAEHQLIGHRGAVMSVAFHPKGSALATGSVDGTIKLWNATDGKLITTLTEHKSWVNSLAYTSDGNSLISGSSDGTVKVWSTKDRGDPKSIQTTKAEVRSVAVNHDSTLLACGIRYGEIHVYDMKTWERHPGYEGSKGDIWAVAFSPDGKYLAAPDGDWNRGSQVKLWDTSTGKVAHQLQHTGEVLSIAFSPDGKWLAAGGGDKNLKIWDFQKAIMK